MLEIMVENWVVVGPSYVELGPQVPAMVGNRSLKLSISNKNHLAPVNKTYILVPCFKLSSNDLRDIKTKVWNFQHKNGCKGH